MESNLELREVECFMCHQHTKEPKELFGINYCPECYYYATYH